MPRRIDYTRGNETDSNEVLLPVAVYGTREIGREEFDAITEEFGRAASAFVPQFSTYGMRDPEDRAAAMDAAHAWLSERATGPWSWTEGWSNHGHHVDTGVYVERVTDQLAFASAHGETFRFHRDRDDALCGLAVVRGA